MGWQGLDLKITAFNSNNKLINTKKLLRFEGDPDDSSWNTIYFNFIEVRDELVKSQYDSIEINMQRSSNIGHIILILDIDGNKKYIDLNNDDHYDQYKISDIKVLIFHIDAYQCI